MSSSGLPQGFSIFQPTLGAQLQFFPAVGTQELDELIHAHLVGPASSQEKRATLALDFLEYAQRTGQTFKFYPVYTVAASPANSASSSFNTSPTTTSWDWSQTSRTASVSSRSSQHRVSKPASPASRVRATDFASLPGMKIMTKDGLDVTNSASRGSKTKEQRDHAHLMRIIKACDSCKRKKIRCDPSHKKRAAATPAAPASTTAKVTKKARTSSPSSASQSISPPQSVSPQSVSPAVMMEDFAGFSASPFDIDATFSFDTLNTFDPTLAAPADLWNEFVQYPPVDLAEDYDFFADPESFLSSQSSDAGLSASRISVPACSPRSGAPPGRGPDVGCAESHTYLLDGAAFAASAQLPFESQDSAGDYTDFNLFSPGSSFSEDERMLDIASSTSGLSTQSIPSPIDSPRRPPNAESPGLGTRSVESGDSAKQPPFTRAGETEPSDRTNVRDEAAGDIAGAISVLSRSDVVMRTNEQGQLIICCPPGTVVVNSSGQGSTKAGLVNVSTVNDPSSSSAYIAGELSESAVASVSSGTGNVDTAVSTWLDHGSSGQSPQPAMPIIASTHNSPTLLVDTLESSGTAVSSDVFAGSTQLATGTGRTSCSTSASTPSLAVGLEAPATTPTVQLVNATSVSSTLSCPLTATSASVTASPVDILGGYVSSESGSLASPASPLSTTQDRGLEPSVGNMTNTTSLTDGEQSPSDAVSAMSLDKQPAACTSSMDEAATCSFVMPSTDRRAEGSESALNVSQAVPLVLSTHKDTTGIGRSLAKRGDQDGVSRGELAVMMQTALTRALVVAAYAQFATGTVMRNTQSQACRDLAPRARNVVAAPMRACAVC
ncbi:transcription factor Cys6 [Cordyceps javanica]|uniref:Transcription factor Cys6 n=1 Tax=Cordyceps javanica TaxID=43265 RepID=A0A545VHS3_9HYPO|nr:transcription factor Cys6 [Cordyceps javanica]TQW12408.1 transcription factor Cys6 [Cordyceps javanica]